MKQSILIIIKPDSIAKGLTGYILSKLEDLNMEILGAKVVCASYDLAAAHYQHIAKKPFFQQTIDYLMGKGYKQKNLLAFVCQGEEAIKKCRKIIGATNPEDAAAGTIRGSVGRITTKGGFENVVHASSSAKEAKREIQLWFSPQEITTNLYPTKTLHSKNSKKKVWA